VRISVGPDIAAEFTDNDLVLITKDNPDDDSCRSVSTSGRLVQSGLHRGLCAHSAALCRAATAGPRISQAAGGCMPPASRMALGDCRWQMHALGLAEGREGQASVRIKVLLTDDSQAGNTKGVER